MSRSKAARAKTYHHRMRAGTKPTAEHLGCRCTTVELSFTWGELMPAMLAALENPKTPGSAKATIRRELLALAAAMDGIRGKAPRSIIRGVPHE